MAILWYFWVLVPWSDFPSVHWRCLPAGWQAGQASYLPGHSHLVQTVKTPAEIEWFIMHEKLILNHQIMEYWKTTVTILLPLLANIFSYWGLLRSGGLNTRKYWLVYDEISPEPSGNPSGSALGISLGLRRYFIVYPSSRHNTVTITKTFVN